jgi:hypothetical protein
MAVRYAIRLVRVRLVALLLCVVAVTAALAPRAEANTGYELDSAHPSASVNGLFPRGLAVDQANGDIYVAIGTTNLATGARGEILRFNSDLSSDGTFAAGGGYYSGVAVNTVSSGFFAAQMELRTTFGNFGTPKLERFDSSGTLLGSFPLEFTDSSPSIAADSAGHVYFPSVTSHSVKIYSSAGALLEEVTCAGCPSGPFGKPESVAVDAAGNLYVADSNPDRVVKLTPSGGAFAFNSLVQSGRGAGAVAVDPGSGDILVGDVSPGYHFHIVAYNSSGTQFDDFGIDIFPILYSDEYEAPFPTYQMAVNGTTHKLYVGSNGNFYAFEKATIPPPSATIEQATGTGQLGSTLNASVNANGHAVLECEFEYTDEADFLANGFSTASHVPCPERPDGSDDVSVHASIAGLSPGSPYRYRVSATSNAGSVSSGAETLETLPELPPLVTTEAAQSVTQTTAKIRASVNPRGGTTSVCRFELGTSVAYGTNLSCLTPPSSATSPVSEIRALTGLLPATTYHYRLVVTTNAGTTKGDDVEFTTVAAPSEPESGGGSSPAPSSSAPTSGTPAPPAGPVVAPPPAQCRKGFQRVRVNGQVRCVKMCPKGTRRKLSRGKAKCVRKKHATRRRAGG